MCPSNDGIFFISKAPQPPIVRKPLHTPDRVVAPHPASYRVGEDCTEQSHGARGSTFPTSNIRQATLLFRRRSFCRFSFGDRMHESLNVGARNRFYRSSPKQRLDVTLDPAFVRHQRFGFFRHLAFAENSSRLRVSKVRVAELRHVLGVTLG